MDGFIGAAFGLAAGTLFVLLGIALALRSIAPNRWYAVNRQTGRHMVITGAILIACGLVGLAALNDPRQQQMLVLICIVVITLGLGYALIAGRHIARQLTEYERSSPDVSK